MPSKSVQGAQDENTPLAMAHYLAEQISHGHLTVYPADGHLSIPLSTGHLPQEGTDFGDNAVRGFAVDVVADIQHLVLAAGRLGLGYNLRS